MAYLLQALSDGILTMMMSCDPTGREHRRDLLDEESNVFKNGKRRTFLLLRLNVKLHSYLLGVPASPLLLLLSLSNSYNDIKCWPGTKVHLFHSDGGIVVSIAAFQAVDPGSIPGHRRAAGLF